jgi:hypothetical protein
MVALVAVGLMAAWLAVAALMMGERAGRCAAPD